jgi:pantoate kinase
VNGDRNYDARTTRRAVEMLLADEDKYSGHLLLNQRVETPIGSGFGASAASCVSATYAVADLLGIRKSKKALALFPYRAEIMEHTGLGTVSVVYDGLGAGAITTAGEPGVALFKKVKVPSDIRIVTATIASFDKEDALSSRTTSKKINRLGRHALKAFLADPTLDSLAQEGERFSRGLGLETPEVRKLLAAAKSSGAMYASQNMVGYATHALVDKDRSKKVAAALSSLGKKIRVEIFEIGKQRARVLRATRR